MVVVPVRGMYSVGVSTEVTEEPSNPTSSKHKSTEPGLISAFRSWVQLLLSKNRKWEVNLRPKQ